MPAANLTRAEASARAELISTTSYDIVVDLTGRDSTRSPLATPDENFVTTSTVRFTSRAGVTHIDAIADEILDASLDGEPLDITTFAESRLPLQLSEGEHELVVTGLFRFSRSGQGLHRFVDPADGRIYTYTQFEHADARRVFANFEQPDLKATFQFTVLAPADWSVTSNAAGVDPTPLADLEGYARWEFAPTKPISTYITAIVAGHYVRVPGELTSSAGKIPASLLARESLIEHLDTDRVFATTQAGFDVFEEAFGVPYPFETYDQAFVPEYNMGAMENAGCVTFRDDLVFRSRATRAQYESRDNTILHELAHMWFGDLVTMRWWDDLWLKESFAEWASHHAQSETDEDPAHAWAAFGNARKTWAYRADQLPSTHPIAADMNDLEAVGLNYDGITYAKGASVLRQLVAFVGQDAFLAGAKEYFSRHAWGNTELSDLLDVLTEASGRELTTWAQQWIQTAGVNQLRAVFETDDEGTFTSFTIQQGALAAYPTLRQHRLGIGLWDRTEVDGREVLRRRDLIEVDIAGPETPIEVLVGERRPDLLILNDGDLTYAKIRLDPVSLETALRGITDIDNELTRTIVWGAAWDMCRDGELPVSDYVDMVLRGAGSESDITGVSRVLGQATAAIDRFTEGDLQTQLLDRWTAGLARLLRGALAGGDHQLAFAKALADSVHGDQSAELVRGWLDDEEVPLGLEVDTELRWHLVIALARRGYADRALIDAELQRDNTITGAERATAAISALPQSDTKSETWQLVSNTPDVANATHRSACIEFWQPGQEDLLAPFEDKYLTLVEQISERAGAWEHMGRFLAQAAVTHLFPATKSFVAKLDAWRKDFTPVEFVDRILLECRNDAQRAAHVRARNAEFASQAEANLQEG